MYARPDRPHQINNCQLKLGLRGQHGGIHKYGSPYIASRYILTVLILSNRGQCSCRRLTEHIYISNEPFMPALMKAFPNITAHYRSGSHTIFRRMANVNIRYSEAYSQVPLLPIQSTIGVIMILCKVLSAVVLNRLCNYSFSGGCFCKISVHLMHVNQFCL